MGNIEECQEPIILPSFGEEFVKWAEKYWRLDKAYAENNKNNSESSTYNYVKDCFAKKIDDMLKEKLQLK